MDADLLKILCCPETHQPLQPALPESVEQLNAQIASGQLRNRAGQIMQEKISGGLVRQDARFLYPVRDNLPILLIEEAIPITPGR